MKYETTLKKSFKLSTDEFSKYLDQVRNAPNTLTFKTKIHDKNAFFFFDNAIFNLIFDLKDKNDELNSLFKHLPGAAANQYIRNSLIVDIKKTNEIEGVFSTRKEIFELFEDLKKRKKDKIGSIVNKYALLLDEKENKDISSCKDIREIYNELMLESLNLTAKEDIPDGKVFRKGPVAVYNKTATKPLHKGLYPEDKIISAVEEAIMLYNDKNINIFVRIALFHFLFEFAHPFYDGNGRMGRYLISYMVSQHLSEIFAFRISAGINNQKNAYYKAFEDCEDIRNQGDLGTFVYAFLKIIDEEYENSIKYAKDKKKEFKEIYDDLRQKHQLTKNEDSVLYVLAQATVFSDFGISINDIATTIEVNPRTVIRALDKLKELKLLQITKVSKTQYFVLKIKDKNDKK